MNPHRFILFLLLGAFLGASTTRAATSDYRVVAWGYNRYGETNVPVAAQSGVTGIAAGFQRTVVLKKDGSVFVWGWNFAGQTNVPVEAQSGVTAIAAGRNHIVALKNDGSVVAWGNDAAGQTSVPGGLNGVTAITAGWEHTVALKSDGSVVAWGDNSSGQTTVPAGLRRVSAISAGAGHTVALKSDGTVVAWGLSDGGQTLVPGGLSGVTAIAAGFDHTVVIQTCPLILSQPSDALVFIGSDATFSVSATTDDPPLRYQWRFNEMEIAGATADTLTVTNAQIVNSGKYNVLVSDKVGSSSTITWIWAVAWCWRRTASVGWREGLSRAAICPLRGERRPG